MREEARARSAVALVLVTWMAVVPAGAAADPGDPDLRLAAAQADVDLSRIPALRDLLPLLPTSALRALGVEATEVGYGGGDLQNPPLAPTDTYVNGTETWTGAHEVVGSLRVNGHLTLDGAALTLLLRGPTDTLSVAPGGTLVVRNSTVSGDMDARHSRVVAQGNLTVDRSTFAHVALSVTVASGRSARIANSTFTQTPTAVDVHSSAVEVRNNRFYEVGTGLLVSAPLGCGGCRIAPVVTGNLFEMATVGVEFGRDADTDFHHNYLGTNRLSVSCTDEAAATIRRNVFDLSVFGAYAGESPLPGKTDGSACALQSNFYESRGGDAERRNLGINDVDDPSPVYPPAAPYSFEEMGFPADLRPGFAPLVVSATTIWTSATVPPIGQPVIVTGQGVTLTVRGATLDLGGGFLGSRQNGTLRLEADGATRTRVEDGSVLLAHQGLSQDAILGAVFATASTKPAVTVYETAARIEDTEFRNQTVAISAEAALQNAGRNQVTIKRTLFQDDGVAITGFMAGTVDDSKFLRNGVAILGALTAPVVRTSEFVGNTVAYFGVLAPVASFADSSVTASQLAFVGAYAGVAINRSSVEYNAVGFTLLGSSVTGGDNNVFHNVVASFTADDLPSPVGVGIQPSTVTLAGHCGKDDAFYTTGTSQVTLTPPLTACPHAEPFPLRFTPRVAGEGGQPGTLPLPGGTIAGPYIAPTGRKLVATGVTVEGKCDRARADCVAPGGFVVGAKPGGGVEIADSVARNVTLAMAGNPNKLVRTLCQGCALFAMDESAGGARLDLTWSRFVGSNIQVERQDNRTTRVERALFEDTSYALRTLAPHAFDRVVSMNGSKISRADLGTLPGAPENLHSDLSVRRSNFARNAEAVRDSDDSTPEQPATAIDARDNWWGADCGPRTATCHGDPVTASTGANAAPPPVTSPFATAPLEIQPDASFTFSPSSPTTQTPVTFTGFATTFAGLGLSYAWDFGEGNASDARVVTRTFPVPGTYSVSFTATDALGGARTVTRTVSVANVPPVADFAASTLAPVEGSVVTFTDASTDADGAVVNWTWDFGDGTPKSYERHPTHVYADGGTRVAKLTARDDLGATATVQRTLSVAHVAPVADFTVSGTTENDTFVFTDASAHPNAPTDSVVTRSWRCDDGATGSGATWTRTFPDGRAYSCRLTVADNDGVTHFRDRAVEVAHVPPVAAFTWTLAPEGQTSTFTDASTHPKVNDTPPAGWTWNWTLGSPSATATTRNATRVFPDGGDYDVTLVVRDNDGQTSSSAGRVSIPHVAPVPSFTAPASVAIGETAWLNSTSFHPRPDDSIATQRWTFGDGTNATGASATHAWAAAGSYTVTLVVTDSDGVTAATTRTVLVGNSPPDAFFWWTVSQAEVNQTVTFYNRSTDPDGDAIVSHEWQVDGAPAGAGAAIQRAFAESGPHRVCLNATDARGATGGKCMDYVVDDHLNLTASVYAIDSNSQTRVTVRVKWDNGTPAAGVRVIYESWMGPGGVPTCTPEMCEQGPPPVDHVYVVGYTDAAGVFRYDHYTRYTYGKGSTTAGVHDYEIYAWTEQGRFGNYESARLRGSYVVSPTTVSVQG